MVKIAVNLLLILVAFAALGYFFRTKPGFPAATDTSHALPAVKISNEDHLLLETIIHRANVLQSFCRTNSYNTTYCFMIDMSIAPGRQRFFVYNFLEDSIEAAGLVTHGSGSITNGEELFFSNEPGSNCTSLGKYRVGKDYYGRFGLAYKLHGLDRSNSKAFERFVVLHAHSCVPTDEVYPSSICPSLGCPTVSPGFLQKLKSYMDAPGKPILLYIYK